MRDDEPDNGPQGLEAVAGVARIALSVWWHTTEWAVRTSLVTPRRILELARDPEKALDLARDLRAAVPGQPDAGDGSPDSRHGEHDSADPSLGASSNGYHEAAASTLREDGAELLRKSRDVRYEEGAHPAYERILSELAPDGGRILRLLPLEGPQPAVDVRTGAARPGSSAPVWWRPGCR